MKKIMEIIRKITKININKKNPGFFWISSFEENTCEHFITSKLNIFLSLAILFNKLSSLLFNLFIPWLNMQSHCIFDALKS